MVIPCYVITLDDDFPNRQSLIEIGLDPVGFKGINAKKDEHLKYMENVSVSCQYTCPKSTIGCGLSHVLLSQKLYDEGIPIALILEDDAYPKVLKLDIDKIIQSVPENWEIIKLHCISYCTSNSYMTKFNDGSNAAYIINRKGMYKVKNLKVNFHIDMQYQFSDIKVYKSSNNLFWTDESTSNIRDDGNTQPHWMSYFLSKPTSGEMKTHHIFLYKIFRIPGTNIEITLGKLVNSIILLILIFVIYNVVSTCRRSR